MDELRLAAELLVADPPVGPPSLDDLARRNSRRRNRRRAVAGAVALVVLVAGSLVAVVREPEPEDRVVTTPRVSDGRLAVATEDGVTLIDERDGVVAEVDLGFAPTLLEWSPNGRWLVASDVEHGAFVDRDGVKGRRLPTNVGDLQWIRAETLLYGGLDGRHQTRPTGGSRRIPEAVGFRSPDGSLLLRTNAGDRSVTVSAPDGSNERRFGPLPEVEAGLIPHGFSPDGSWFVYNAYPANSASIAMDGVPLYAISVADGSILRIGVSLGRPDWIQWSPDRRTLLVVVGAGRFLTDRKVLRSCDLTVPRCDDLPSAPENVSTFAPAWSLDGGEIAFIGRKEDADGGSYALWVSAADGGAQFRADARFLAAPVRTVWTSDGGVLVILVTVTDEGAMVMVDRVPIHGGERRDRFAAVRVPVAMAQGGPEQASPPMAWSPSAR